MTQKGSTHQQGNKELLIWQDTINLNIFNAKKNYGKANKKRR
jgi:hypothetical protein